MLNCRNSQEVGLEAATLQRVRNSSLVEWFCAENSTGLSMAPKLWVILFERMAVGERLLQQRSEVARPRGAERSENAGMSSVRSVRTASAVYPRFPTEGQSA